MKDTIPYFVVGSGRCGTRSIYKLLSGVQGVEVHHEYGGSPGLHCSFVQPLAFEYHYGIQGVHKGLIGDFQWRRLHGSAIHYSKAEKWVDCSCKLFPLIPVIRDWHPNARFVYLVRDGRKVASSYFHKLPDEAYEDEATAIMLAWLADRSLPIPPPEKRFWWPIPAPDQRWHEEFKTWDRFQRCCWLWMESNRVLLNELQHGGNVFMESLENLKTYERITMALIDFFGIPWQESFWESLQRPSNVVTPIDFPLTAKQNAQFTEICGSMMERLGYAGKEEYRVQY